MATYSRVNKKSYQITLNRNQFNFKKLYFQLSLNPDLRYAVYGINF